MNTINCLSLQSAALTPKIVAVTGFFIENPWFRFLWLNGGKTALVLLISPVCCLKQRSREENPCSICYREDNRRIRCFR